MSTEMTKVVLAVPAIDASETVQTALGVAMSVTAGFSIKTQEDREQANDTAIIVKRGIKTIEDALTEADRPIKRAMEARRMNYADKLVRLKTALSVADSERGRWDREEAVRVRKEAERAQAAADAAAKAAAEANAALMDGEEPLPAAQVVVPQVQRTTRGALATSSSVRRVRAVALEDAQKAAEEWGLEIVSLNERVANERYNAKMKLGLLAYPPDLDPARPAETQGVVVGGVRYVSEVGYSDRRSGA